MNLTEQTVEPKAPEEEVIEIDPETGLPKLPEGYAWRVEPSGKLLSVEIVMRVETKPDWIQRLFGAKPKVSWTTHGSENIFRLCYDYCESDKDSLKECAEYIYRGASNRLKAKENQNTLVGLYPPKSLNS